MKLLDIIGKRKFTLKQKAFAYFYLVTSIDEGDWIYRRFVYRTYLTKKRLTPASSFKPIRNLLHPDPRLLFEVVITEKDIRKYLMEPNFEESMNVERRLQWGNEETIKWLRNIVLHTRPIFGIPK